MKSIQFCITVFFATTFTCLGAFAQTPRNPIPPQVMNTIYWNIQTQTSFSSMSERASILWTPKVIELQSLEGESMMPSLYTPPETLFRLSFDVGIGHNMDEGVIHWRKCNVVISQIADRWGAPLLDCQSFAP